MAPAQSHEPDSPSRSGTAELGLATLVAAITYASWAPHVEPNEWLSLDDHHNFVHNPNMALGTWAAVMDSWQFQQSQAARVASLGMYEPIAMSLKIGLRAALFDADAWPPPNAGPMLHAGVVCHCCSAAVLYMLSLQLVRLVGGVTDIVAHACAVAGALAWASSTCRAEVLGWASALPYSFAALLVTLSLVSFVTLLPRHHVLAQACATLFGTLAMFCKSAIAPIGLVVAALSLACEASHGASAVQQQPASGHGKPDKRDGESGQRNNGSKAHSVPTAAVQQQPALARGKPEGHDGESGRALALRLLRHVERAVPLLVMAGGVTACQLAAMPQKPGIRPQHSVFALIARALEVSWLHTAVLPGSERRLVYPVPPTGFLTSQSSLVGAIVVSVVSIAAVHVLLAPAAAAPVDKAKRRPSADGPIRLVAACWLSYLALLLPGTLLQSTHTFPGMGHDRYLHVASLCFAPLPALASAALAALPAALQSGAGAGTRGARRAERGSPGLWLRALALLLRLIPLVVTCLVVALQMRATPAAAAPWQTSKSLFNHSHPQLVQDAKPLFEMVRKRREAAVKAPYAPPLTDIRQGADTRTSCPMDALKGGCETQLVKMNKECPGSCGVLSSAEADHRNTLASYLDKVYTQLMVEAKHVVDSENLTNTAHQVSDLILHVSSRHGQHMFKRGERAFHTGNFDLAMSTFDWVLTVWPRHHQVWGIHWARAWGYDAIATLRVIKLRRANGADEPKKFATAAERVGQMLTTLMTISLEQPFSHQINTAIDLLRELGYKHIAADVETALRKTNNLEDNIVADAASASFRPIDEW